MSDSEIELTWNEQLFYAIKERQKKEISRMKNIDECLRKGADINAQDEKGNTILHLAIRKGYKEIVRFLLTKGARTDIPNKRGSTVNELIQTSENATISNESTLNSIRQSERYGGTIEYEGRVRKKAERYNLQFASPVEGLESFMQNVNKQLFRINTKSTFLTLTKVLENLEARHMDFTFLDLHSLVQGEAIFNDKSFSTLVVECNIKVNDDSKLKLLFDQLCAVVNDDENTKMIIITQEADAFAQKITDEFRDSVNPQKRIKYTETEDANIQVKDLRDVSEILRQDIRIMGEQINLGSLVCETMTEIIDLETFTKLISGEVVTIFGRCSPLKGTDESYVPRKFNHLVEIKEDFLDAIASSHIPDKFVINGSFSMTCPNENIYFFNECDVDGAEAKFNNLSAKYSNVHWLRQTSGLLTLQRSHGSIDFLIKYKRSLSITNPALFDAVTEEQVIQDRHKVVIVFGSRGEGKTTVLTRLAELLKREFPNLWLIRIDFSCYIEAIKKNLAKIAEKRNLKNLDELKSNIDEDIAIEFLLDLLTKEPSTLRSTFEENLLRNCLMKQDKVAVILHGLDHINLNYKDTVISLIEKLARFPLKKLIVSAHSGLANILEMKLGSFSYNLIPYSKEEEVEFLVKRWEKELKSDTIISELVTSQCLKKYAEALMKRFSKLTKSTEDNFIKTPLMGKMLAEAFLRKPTKWTEWECCEEYVKSEQYSTREPHLPEILNLSDLYDSFVEKTFSYIYPQEKINTEVLNETEQDSICETNLYSCFKRENQLLAVFKLFGKENVFFSSVEIETLIEHLHDSKGNMERTEEITDSRLYFIHESFLDYYVADVITEIITNTPRNESVLLDFLLTKILFEDTYFRIRIFLNGSFGKKKIPEERILSIGRRITWLWERGDFLNENCQTVFHVAAEECNENIVKLLVDSLREFGGPCGILNAKDKVGTTVLHIACKTFSKSDTVKLLIEGGVNINVVNNDGMSALHWAAHSNNLQIAKLLVENGADVNLQNKSGLAILHQAAMSASLDFVEWLVSKGADINVKSNNGRNLLHWAVHGSRLQTVRWLYQKGFDINSKGEDNFTALHLAAVTGCEDIVKWLVLNGADIQARTGIGWSVLHTAVLSDNLNLTKWLVTNGADINIKDNSGRGAIDVAISRGNLESVKWFVNNGADLGRNGSSELLLAASLDKWEIVKYLLRNGAEADFDDYRYGWTLLYWTARYGNLSELKELLQEGADINAKTTRGLSVLHLAAESGKLDVVEWLIEKGAIVTARNDKEESVLHSAAEGGNLETVECLIRNGANINATDCDGRTPLYVAAQCGHLEIVKWMVENGSDVNAKSKDGGSILHSLRVLWRLDMLEFLVRKSVDVNSKNGAGKSVLELAIYGDNKNAVEWLIQNGAHVSPNLLHVAVINANIDIIQLLINSGVDINGMSDDSPLFTALLLDEVDILKLLVQNGADLNARNMQGQSVLHLAASDGKLDALDWLIHSGADINLKDNDGRSALYLAVLYDQTETAIQLVANGANTDGAYGHSLIYRVIKSGMLSLLKALTLTRGGMIYKDEYGNNVLHLAVEEDKPVIINWLLMNNVNINVTDTDGRSALDIAARRGNLPLMNFLLHNGIDINSKDKDGRTPLYAAAKEGKLDAVKLLTEKGANVNEKDEDGRATLHAAAKSGELKIVEYLVENCANVNERDNRKLSALDVAAEEGHWDIVKWLINNGADATVQFENPHRSSYWTSADRVKFLIENGVDINTRDKTGSTALHWAIENDELDVVEWLLDNGSDINAKKENGWSILHSAAAKGNPTMVEQLLQRGADVAVINDYGRTPLFEAVKAGSLETVKRLYENGALLDVIDRNKWSVLHAAAAEGDLETVKWLVDSGADVNQKSADGWSVLYASIRAEKLDIAKWLVQNGVKVNVEYPFSNNELSLAAESDDVDTLNWITENFNDVFHLSDS